MRMHFPCCMLWISEIVCERKSERRFVLIVRVENGFGTRTIPKRHAHVAALSLIKNRRAAMTVQLKEPKDTK